eukprot:TRINITY_DN49941_c0_g1_i1.p1 TRINITY_DN49941_c0_g1~~TRINITY_DN49941_c0_g1_i1.p1  ORF type:complete len:394 (-),score=92.92 TRINITY_DN49941_c0_g1_i1:257-1438(-)
MCIRDRVKRTLLPGSGVADIVDLAKERKAHKKSFFKIIIRYMVGGIFFGFVCHYGGASEEVFLAGFAVATAVTILAIAASPAIIMLGAGDHRYADDRCWLGGCCGVGRVRNTSDVISNFPFLWVGVETLAALSTHCEHGVPVLGAEGGRVQMTQAEVYGWTAVALGWCAVCFGSSLYHIVLDDQTLAADRAPIAIIVLGFTCIAIEERLCSLHPSTVVCLLALGMASVGFWYITGSAKPYYTTQYFGFALTGVLVISRPAAYTLDLYWGFGVLGYVVAKILEEVDEPVYRATGRLVSGHTLKHLVTAYGGHLTAVMLAERQAILPVTGKSVLANQVGTGLLGIFFGVAVLGVMDVIRHGVGYAHLRSLRRQPGPSQLDAPVIEASPAEGTKSD